jgi:DNA repair exonuclease SbcCD ATPase subunit
MDLSALEKENEAYRRNQQNMVVDTVSIARELDTLRTRLSGKQKLLANEEQFISFAEEKITAARNEWAGVSVEAFSGGTCASCGQALPADKLQRAMEAFEANRKDRLRRIEATAASLKDTKAQAEYRIASYREEISGLEGEIQGKEQQLAAAQANVVTVADMEDYAARKATLEDRLDDLTKELAAMADNTITVKGQLQQQIEDVKRQIARAAEIVNKRTMLDYAHNRIETLRQDAKNAAECLEAVEKMLYLIDEYTRYKTRFVEDSVNSLFRLAKFRLYREQANGGVEDRCDVVYDGVPYLGLNNGMKINVGIDIINALSRHHGVCVPLFVDNAESVTQLECAGTQVVRLVVSAEDKKLRCVNENP